MHRKVSTILAVLVVSVSLAACGSATKTVTTKTVTAASATQVHHVSAKSRAGKAYLAAVDPMDSAILSYETDGTKTPIALVRSTDHRLLVLAHQYPAAASDIEQEVSDDLTVLGEIHGGANAKQLLSDVQTDGWQANIRSDLGLPQS